MRKMNALIGVALATAVLSGCSSTQKTADNHIGEDRVISRIDGMSSRPDWLKESEPFRFENSKVLSLGMTIIPADNNVSAAYRIASNNSKALISHSIESRLSFILQNGEQGTELGVSQAEYIGAEASKLTTHSLRPARQYWEKVAVVDQSGQTTLQLRVFSMSEMDERDFKSAIIEAIRKSNGAKGITRDFARKLNDHWDKFVKEGDDTRTPTSAKADDN